MVRGLNASQWCEASSPEQLAQDLANAVSANLAETLDNHDRGSLLLSGGSTPLPFLKQLAKADIEWSRIDVTLVDERWVPDSDNDSNARFLREHFFVEKAADATFYSLYRDKEPALALPEVVTSLQPLTRPYSVVVLGMGGDGHTASLFPDTEGLGEALDLDSSATLAVMAPKSVPQVRISFTRAALLQSRYRYLHITGEQKRNVLETALAQDSEDDRLPIASFFEKHLPPISVYWAP